MDDKRMFELTALELAYKRQLLYMGTAIAVALIGLVVYITTIYRYNLQMVLVAAMLMSVGTIFIIGMDTKLRGISRKIRNQ